MLLAENRELLDRFRKGEQKALKEVYVAYVDAVAKVIRFGFTFSSRGRSCRYRGAHSQFELEDRIHEVFLRAFTEKTRQQYDGVSSYTAYLRTIAKNLIIDDFRKKEHQMMDYSVEITDPEPSSAPQASVEPLEGAMQVSGQPEHDTENREILARVSEFQASLGERERKVFSLRFQEQLEHQQIAEQTGFSKSQIKTSEKRIRTLFFEYMQRHGYFQNYVQEQRGWLRKLRGY